MVRTVPKNCFKGLKMVVLNWVFCNGHAWTKSFETIEHAEQHAYQLGLFQSPTIDRAWIDGLNGQTWLKEKTND